METIERMANREILKYAVQRKMFHDCCGTIADVRKSVLVEAGRPGETRGFALFALYCHGCVDLTAVQDLTADGYEVDVYDGKVLYE